MTKWLDWIKKYFKLCPPPCRRDVHEEFTNYVILRGNVSELKNDIQGIISVHNELVREVYDLKHELETLRYSFIQNLRKLNCITSRLVRCE